MAPALSKRVISKSDNKDEESLLMPAEYTDYANVFSSNEGNQTFPLSKQVHTIDLEGNTLPTMGLISPLAKRELEALREYLRSAMEKGWIQPSSSLIRAPILFIFKKGGELRLCVDYHGLNQVTKKNKAPLPLISEILDRLGRAKVFTKLDLKDAYH